MYLEIKDLRTDARSVPRALLLFVSNHQIMKIAHGRTVVFKKMRCRVGRDTVSKCFEFYLRAIGSLHTTHREHCRMHEYGNIHEEVPVANRNLMDKDFVPGGGNLNDFRAGTTYSIRQGLTLEGFLQYERWNMPLLATGAQSNTAVSAKVTFNPCWIWKTKSAPGSCR
jgi:hypothetical protein